MQAKLSTSEYVLGAMVLYMDIANLFLYLLKIADSSGGGGSSEDRSAW